jgi:hypothetical protein
MGSRAQAVVRGSGLVGACVRVGGLRNQVRFRFAGGVNTRCVCVCVCVCVCGGRAFGALG